MEMDVIPYSLVVGILMYTMVYTRPHIAHRVRVVSELF